MENMILGAFVQSVQIGGITFNLEGKSPEKGYMVSIVGQEIVIPELDYIYDDLENYINERMSLLNSMSNLYVGVWHHKGHYYIDLSENILSKADALKQGILRSQKAIWNVSEGSEIALPSPQLSGTEFQKQTYLNLKVRELL